MRHTFVVLLLLLCGCGGPEDNVVAADFQALFDREVGPDATPIITFVGAGEGDGGNVYMHVRFDLIARRNVAFASGWFEGLNLQEGARFSGGEVVMLYQKLSFGGDWELTRHWVTRRPARSQ